MEYACLLNLTSLKLKLSKSEASEPKWDNSNVINMELTHLGSEASNYKWMLNIKRYDFNNVSLRVYHIRNN